MQDNTLFKIFMFSFIFFMLLLCRPGQEGRQRFNTTLLETCGAMPLVMQTVVFVLVIPLLFFI
jgi:hypothetical protein